MQYTIKVPDGLILVNETTGMRHSCGLVALGSKDKFYFEKRRKRNTDLYLLQRRAEGRSENVFKKFRNGQRRSS